MQAVIIAFIIVLFVVSLILAIDWEPQFNTWQSRIHIGRWKGCSSWPRALGWTFCYSLIAVMLLYMGKEQEFIYFQF